MEKKQRNALLTVYACSASKLFAQAVRAEKRGAHGVFGRRMERTRDNMQCRIANNREQVSTCLASADIIIDSVTGNCP